MELTAEEFGKLLEMREPDPSELALINTFRPKGIEPYVASELIRFAMVASNNLLHSNLTVFSDQTLEIINRGLPGCDLMLDHQWEDSQKTCGFIYDSLIYVSKYYNPAQLSKILQKSRLPETDRKFINNGGYKQILAFAVTEKSHPVVSDIIYRRRSDVSIGGHFYGDFICPLCKTSLGSDNCEHLPPMFSPFVEERFIAPYVIYSGDFSIAESSLVFAGKCLNARIISDGVDNSVII